MKQRMLVAGVALAFASAAWAEGECNGLAHSKELSSPKDAVVSVADSRSEFVLVEWEAVEDATQYTIYHEVPIAVLADSRGRTVELEPRVAVFVPWGTVEAVAGKREYSTRVATPNADPTAWGVAAAAQINGRLVSSPMVTARWIEAAIATAVEAMSWGEVKAQAE